MYVDRQTKLLVITGADPCPPARQNESPDEKVDDLRRGMEDYAFKKMPRLALDTINDFHARENDCFQLSRKINIPVEYALVTEQDLKPLFPEGEFDRFWTRFYSKYPNSTGVISFSNPGFNRSFTQALISTGRSCGGLCGAGHLVLLTKTRGMWRVQTKVETWVS
jgi:hypothetical protein